MLVFFGLWLLIIIIYSVDGNFHVWKFLVLSVGINVVMNLMNLGDGFSSYLIYSWLMCLLSVAQFNVVVVPFDEWGCNLYVVSIIVLL